MTNDSRERHDTADPWSSVPGVRELLDADGTAVMVLGLDREVRLANEAALTLLGVESPDDLRGEGPGHALVRSFLDHAPRRLVSGATDGVWQGDIDHTTTAGEYRVFRATIAVNTATNGHDGFIGVTAHDVTAARLQMSKLRHRATHDPLTGLSNRRQIMAMLGRAIGEQRDQPGHVAAMFIDVDRLKYVNDALGHQVGDRLLVSTAERLSEAIRPHDHVARLGGDEFLVVAAGMRDATVALDLADRIRRALSGRLRINQLDLQFSVSIGVALTDARLLANADVDAASELVSNADTAMYEAKSTGRRRCVLYTSHMHSAARERTEIAAALTQAISTSQLTVEYQPVYSAVTRQATAAEALVRWHHPVRGRIDTSEFVSIAEESGTVARLGELVLDQAMVDLRRWIDGDVVDEGFVVHVNVSQMQLASGSFVNHVLAMLRRHHLAPTNLVLETRERALLGRNTDIDRTVRALRRIGVGVAIDNFGTGPNALSVLTDVGADILKLDGSLALPAGTTEADTRLVRSVVLLAHALDMRVVAERVSGVEQLRRLRTAGCDELQGNLLSPPVPAAQLAASTRF